MTTEQRRPAPLSRIAGHMLGTLNYITWRLDEIERRQRWHRQHIRPETEAERWRRLSREQGR